MLIVGPRVSDAPNDQQELVATVQAIRLVVAGDMQVVRTSNDSSCSKTWRQRDKSEGERPE